RHQGMVRGTRWPLLSKMKLSIHFRMTKREGDCKVLSPPAQFETTGVKILFGVFKSLRGLEVSQESGELPPAFQTEDCRIPG
ncbi:MAG: hypothetical protein WCO86_18545, partial [Planctomycetota bacterium]